MTTNINFKTVPQYNNRNNVKFRNQNQMMLTDSDLNDMFAMQDMQSRQAEKKEKNKERWNKTGIIAQVVLAISFADCAKHVVKSRKPALRALRK